MSIADNNSCVDKGIISLINSNGLKQCSIAARAGYTANEFSGMMNNRKVIKALDVYRIAKALNVTPNELFGIGDTH